MRRFVHIPAARIIGLAILFGLPLAHAQKESAPDVPDAIQVRAGQEVVLFAHASGSQIYTCQTGADGNILFVANSGSNNVSAFAACIQVNTTCSSPSGMLTQVSGSPFPAGTGPISIIVDPVADFVYALDRSSFQVSQYGFSPATGALSLLSPSSVSTGASPLSGAITLEGNWFFVANNAASSLSAYSVSSTGKLNAATTSSVVLTGQPSAVLIR